MEDADIPRKRYSWTFLRSALGISLIDLLAGAPEDHLGHVTCMIASSWRYSGNRFNQCLVVGGCGWDSRNFVMCGGKVSERMASAVRAS